MDLTTHAELSAFNDAWLDAWTRKDIPAIAAMYTEDCRFMDAATARGLAGRAALEGYLGRMFPVVPAWRYWSDELWAIPGGFCARWFCEFEGGRKLRGFDFVQLRGQEIAVNEVYTHEIGA
ncbi:MAG: nuclear transport factor 2 family protein [Sphingomonadales bacterium]|nr:nuclear transport factor 2 family protein [Sphingomonadales bacterium]